MFREVEKMRKEVLEEKNTDTVTSKNCVAKCLYKKLLFNYVELIFRVIEKIRIEV